MARWVPPILLLPLAGYFLLVAQPPWDVHWENDRAHFWLVFAVALIDAALGLAIGEVARRRGDARVVLVGLTLLTSAGFLGLHALATPGIVLSGKNTGFVVATPVGLALAAAFTAASALDLSGARGVAIVRREPLLRTALLLLLAAWAGYSLASLPPLDDPLPPSEATGPLVAFAVVGVSLYAFAAWRYVGLFRRHPSLLLAAVTSAYVLLAEALIAVAFARNWHATWWEWHVLMATAFLLVAAAVRREYSRAGSVAAALGSLYLEQTIARVDADYAQALAELAAASPGSDDVGRLARATAERFGLDAEQAVLLERAAAQMRDVDRLFRPYVPVPLAERLRRDPAAARLGGMRRIVSVLFADLQGFTTFSERADDSDVIAMLNAYWAVIVPVVVRDHRGLIERFAGDAVMVVFNAEDDQPDHARRAVHAALAMQRETEAVAAERPGWPRFRAGVNTGAAVIGNVGTAEQRSFAAIGDTTNLAARLQAAAAPGQVVIGEATAHALGDELPIRALGPIDVKGRADPVAAFAVASD